jgi:MFS family permease
MSIVAEAISEGMRRSDGAARWNFFANVMDGALFALALSFVSQTTILPMFVREIGGGNLAVGMIPVVWTVGFNVPQLFVAGKVQQGRRKKSLLLRTALGQRIPWLVMAAIIVLFFGRIPADAALAGFFLIYALAAIGGAINLPVWFDLIVDLTPVRRRGRLFGIRSICGSLLGIAGGATAASILGWINPPVSYGILFFLAFASMMCSYVFLMSLKVTEAADQDENVVRRLGLIELVSVMRAHPDLRNFLVSDALQISAMTAAGFLMVHAAQQFSLPASSAGTFTMVMMGSMIAGGLVFGFCADRYGHKLNLLLAATASALASLGGLALHDPALYGVVFVFAALTVALNMISRLPFLAELSPVSTRPAIVAMANVVTAPFVFWGALSGLLADAVGFTPVFVIAILLSGMAFVVLALGVRDPRKFPPPQISALA